MLVPVSFLLLLLALGLNTIHHGALNKVFRYTAFLAYHFPGVFLGKTASIAG